MLKIRLKRFGKKRETSYRIIAIDSKSRRDGRPVEELGFYNPRTDETRLNVPAIVKRLEQGAQPSETVRSILDKAQISIDKKYSKSKCINVWITNESGKLFKDLRFNQKYTLNCMVGESLEGNYLEDTSSEIIHPNEIGDDGLQTNWVVSSSTIEMKTLGDKTPVSVTTLPMPKQLVYIAKFPLFIPAQGNSETVKFLTIPKVLKETSLNILVYARGELFRQLEILLDVIDPIDTNSVSKDHKEKEHSILAIKL